MFSTVALHNTAKLMAHESQQLQANLRQFMQSQYIMYQKNREWDIQQSKCLFYPLSWQEEMVLVQISGGGYTIFSSQVRGLTLRPFESPSSESCAHTLRLLPPLLHSSSHPAIIFRSSDCSDGQFSFRYSNPVDCITPANTNNQLRT